MAIVANPVDTFYLSRKSTPVIQRGKFSPLLSARTNRSPVNYRYTKQMAHRKFFNQVKILWDNLSGIEKSAWQSFASTWFSTNKYGDVISLGAWQWFCRYNITLLSATLGTIDLPPSSTVPSYSPSFIVFDPDTTLGWFFNVSISIPTGAAILVQRKINLPYQRYKPPLPFNTYRAFTSSDIEPFQLATIAEVPKINKRFFVRLKACDSFGRAGSWNITDKVSI